MCNITHAQDWRMVAQVRVTESCYTDGFAQYVDSIHFYYKPNSNRGSEGYDNDLYKQVLNIQDERILCDSAQIFTTRVYSDSSKVTVEVMNDASYSRIYDINDNLLLSRHYVNDTCYDEHQYIYDDSNNLVKYSDFEYRYVQDDSNYKVLERYLDNYSVFEYDTMNRLIKSTGAAMDLIAADLLEYQVDTHYMYDEHIYNKKGLNVKDSSYANFQYGYTVSHTIYDEKDNISKVVNYDARYSISIPDSVKKYYIDTLSIKEYTYNSASQLIKEYEESDYQITYTYYPDGKRMKSEYHGYDYDVKNYTYYTYTPFGKIASIETCSNNRDGYDITYFYYEQYEPKTDAHE